MPDSSAWGTFSDHPPRASGSQAGRGRLESSRPFAVESAKKLWRNQSKGLGEPSGAPLSRGRG
eukprot:8182337-Alexandrium_andersonii.AAC.1